jgi:predicted anti-sigma-YlaC factor YlaD
MRGPSMKHLSSEQLSACISGEPDRWIMQHAGNCPACRAELEQMREALSEFRGAVRRWSEYQAQAALAIDPRPPQARSWVAAHQLALALVLAAVCILASIVWHGAENAPASDAVLLNQVDAEVSRAVPSSMEPLMKLVAQE